MPRPSVLILCEDLALAEILRSAVGRAGGVTCVDGVAPVAIVGARTRKALAALLTRAPADSEAVVVHTGTLGVAAQLDAFSDARVRHYIHESIVERALTPTLRKLLSGDLFGLDKYLPAAHTRRLRIDSYAGRGLALDAVMREADNLGLPRIVREQMSTATEELLLNALYEAPIDDNGKPVFADLDSRERLSMRSPKPVSLRYASTDQMLAISIRDRFGRLRKEAVLGAIRAAHEEAVVPGTRTLGNLRGFHNVLTRATTVSINVAAGVVSEVVCTFTRQLRTHGALCFFSHGRVAETSHA